MSTQLQENNPEFELSEFLNQELKLWIEESPNGELKILSKGEDGKFYWADWYPTGTVPDSKLFEITIHRATEVHHYRNGEEE